MEAIGAVDRNWAIGCQGQLLQPIAEDLRRFRTISQGRILLYGRGTLSSFPGGRILPGRLNLILSRSLKLEDIPLRRPEEAQDIRILAASEALRDCIVREGLDWEAFLLIGGGQVYRDFLPYCRGVYLTEIAAAFEGADAWFPNLESLEGWRCREQGAWCHDAETGLDFRYSYYVNAAPRELIEG